MTGHSVGKGCIEMKFNNNEEAVSPVIGVILMVAITVILAAVIAVFVFGMADGMEGSHNVAVTAKNVNSTSVMFTLNGGADAGVIKHLEFSMFKDGVASGLTLDPNYPAGSAHDATTVKESGGTIKTLEWENPGIGESIKIVALDTGKGEITVTAHFSDGTSSQVLKKLF